PFDNTSVDFLEELGFSFYKIASFEMIDLPLLQYVASKGKPIIMSTGMGKLEEIEEAIDAIYKTGNKQLAIMKCSSAYLYYVRMGMAQFSQYRFTATRGDYS
ncbi:MAG: N-acetylneuraminate synthase family protein, partial [Bacteroidaceae bacterium]|nr:N-acetylneuraminate synthase family protein [Bacteroidaceae bacterium]